MRCHICHRPMRIELGEDFGADVGPEPPTVIWACNGCGLWVPAPTWTPPPLL